MPVPFMDIGKAGHACTLQAHVEGWEARTLYSQLEKLERSYRSMTLLKPGRPAPLEDIVDDR